MSNGPYGQIACRCGVVTLLVCGSPLGRGQGAGDEPVIFWPLEGIQVGGGADELAIVRDGRGGDAWSCRRCDERLLHAHDEAGVAALAGDLEDIGDLSMVPSLSQRRCLEALGYRVVPGE
ncbi:hypothetical protein DFP85_106106 [Halomonas ventosae]|uniref:Uncharacterized protein n=1 Tax=Halomonas ventosae TaxID=229007 RepID=A0A4R6ZQR6_9GAMM|nr:hypothetical protein [Halomonas ventosae]TDR54961.1 hypothetical protein DFP85_106106 [Halomonas ventosae]